MQSCDNKLIAERIFFLLTINVKELMISKYIKYALPILFLFLVSDYVDASIADIFKDEQGRTKWQHVANFSGSVLIVLLTITLLGLLVSRIKLSARNKELREIKKDLEGTVRRRTEKLDRANRLLESEVEEHKSTQSYLQSILASMPSMLIGLNENSEITHWNRTAESITGFTDSQVLGKRLWDAYPSVTVDPQQVDKVFETREPEIIKHGQRGQYYFDITIYPLNGPRPGVVLIIENVTQRSLAENMLIQRDKMASMGELAATMAYDINAPLRGILADVGQVADEIAEKNILLDHQDLITDAIERGKQASAVINNLLAFSGAQRAEKKAADVVAILDHAIELAGDVLSGAGQVKFRDISLETQYQPELPKIDCYEAELQQVFLSLFRQAWQSFGDLEDASYALIRVSAREELDQLWVTIEHNGRCLTPEEQQEIFEPFVQHTTPVNPKPTEVNNRLSFSYFIVTEHHGGEMAVTSNVDSGSAFHMQFHLD